MIAVSEINPLSPPSDPVQRRLQSPPAKTKFLGVPKVRHGGLALVAVFVINAHEATSPCDPLTLTGPFSKTCEVREGLSCRRFA